MNFDFLTFVPRVCRRVDLDVLESISESEEMAAAAAKAALLSASCFFFAAALAALAEVAPFLLAFAEDAFCGTTGFLIVTSRSESKLLLELMDSLEALRGRFFLGGVFFFAEAD